MKTERKMTKFDKGLTLFEECLSVLGTWRVIALEEEQEKIMNEFCERFPIAWWGRIDWNAVEKKYPIVYVSDIVDALKKENKTGDEPLYIIWSHGDDPMIETTLEEVLRNLEDVEPVSPDKFLYCPTEGWVLEIFHDGDITLGIL